LSESLVETLLVGENASEEATRAAAERWVARRAELERLLPRELTALFASILPLAQGERAVLAMPFALTGR
jgi:hypothetical protein